MPVKKKAAKKRAYNRKPKLIPPAPPSPLDGELKELLAVISIFENWTSDQRSRNLKYLASRYYDFL
jgi:hypothetical protein